MEIRDMNGNILEEYDPSAGRIEKRTETIFHEAIEGVEETGHYETVQEYDNGGKDIVWVTDTPATESKAAYSETTEYRLYIPYTPEEIDERSRQQQISELKGMLAATDYIAAKLAEGAATRDEYETELELRQMWRDEINNLLDKRG